MKLNELGISNELEVYRFKHGIKLNRPNASAITPLSDENYSRHTVSSLLKIPCSIYFDNTDGVIQKLNEHNVQLCGLDSVKQAIGKKYRSSFTRETAQLLLNNDHKVMKNETIKIVEEDIFLSNKDLGYQALSIKMPWYNSQNKIIGLFGCSIILGTDPLASSLALIASMGLLIPAEYLSAHIGLEVDNIYLSIQQQKCAKFLLTGMSIKEIALRMNLSARTVESYINNIKTKLKCYNRTELIIKLHRIIKSAHMN